MTEYEKPKRRLPGRQKEIQFVDSKPMRVSRQNLPHCCKADMMHICLGADSEDTQKTCHFRLPSTGGARCMDLRFEEFCTNKTLHQYLQGGITDSRASIQVGIEKKRLAKINDRLEGHNINFPLEGEETFEDLQRIYSQLHDIGINKPEFWVDAQGKSGSDYEYLNITIDQILDGKWFPRNKKYSKDVMRYIKLKDKLG